jgi:hypothetical protein
MEVTNRTWGVFNYNLAAGTPLLGVIAPLAVAVDRPDAMFSCVLWCGFWIMVHATAAALLLGATIATFDRRFGRVRGLPKRACSALRKDAGIGPQFAGVLKS